MDYPALDWGRRQNRPAPAARYCLAIFVGLLVFDGAIRKWLFPGAEQIIFVVKDAVILAAFLFFFAQQRIPSGASLAPAARLLFTVYVLWVALEAFNPRLPNILVGVWGMKSHVLYAALIPLLPMAFLDLRDLLSTLERVYPWIVIPVVSVSLFQLAAPAYSVLNQTVRGGEEAVAVFGYAGLVRVAGTFSYLSGMVAFVQTATLLGIALFLGGARSKWFIAALAFALLAVPVTGSRAVVIVLVAGSALLLLAATLCRFVSGGQALLAGAVLALFSVISLQSQGPAWQALVERAEGSRQDQNRITTAFTNAFDYFESAGATGFGAGAANLGAPILVKGVEPFSWLPYGNRFEEESGRIVIELGVIGWATSLAMRMAFAIWAVTLALRGATATVRAGAVIALPVVVLGVWQGNGVFAPPLAAAFYWFAVAVLALAERENRWARKKRAMDMGSRRSLATSP
jgi:hypothetical protein